MSKHRKIREMFGPGSSYHPNQLPLTGLCHKEIMDKLACTISELRVLQERGQLSIDPWDFLRWRIARKAQSVVGSTWESTRNIIKSVAIRMCDDSAIDHSEKFKDCVLREAVLRSAEYQGRLRSFGRKKTTKSTKRQQKPTRTFSQQSTRSQGFQSASTLVPVSRPSTSSFTIARERQGRATRLARPSESQGVNAFRAQQVSRSRELPSNTASER